MSQLTAFPAYPISSQLPVGSRVRLEDRSGRVPPMDLVGTILGSTEAMNDVDQLAPCYVVQYQDGRMESLPIEDVHDEWQVLG